MRVLRVYNKDWEFLDEIYEYSNLEYTKGINTIDTMTFDVPLNSRHATPEILEFMNKIEYIDITMENGKEIKNVIWRGVIVDRTFNSANIQLGCYSLLFLLSKRRLKNDEEFEQCAVNYLAEHIVQDANSDIQDPTHYNYTLQLGEVVDINEVWDYADRKFKSDDIALDQLIKLADEFGYYVYEKDGKLVFDNKLGETKDNYILQFSKENANDNILKLPSLNQSVIDTVNNIHGRVEYEKEYSEEDEETEKSNTATTKNECQVKKVDIWIREKADWDSAQIIVAPANSKLTVITKGKSWSKVEYKSKQGYVANDYVTFLSTTTDTSSESSDKKEEQSATVKKSDFYLREKADYSSAKLLLIKKSTKLVLLEKGKTWSKVMTKDLKTTGYIANDYLTFSTSKTEIALQTDEVFVSSDNVYIQKTSDDDAEKIAKVKKGTVLKLHNKYDKWSKVENKNGKVGYIKNTFLSFAKSVKQDKEMIIISSTRVNNDSQYMYGILEGSLSVDSDTREISTIRTLLDRELDTISYATNTIDVDVIDSWICPMSDVGVGDKVTLFLEPYFGFKNTVRILEISYSEKSNTYKLKLGNTVFKIEKPRYKIYSKADNSLDTMTYVNKDEISLDEIEYDIENEEL